MNFFATHTYMYMHVGRSHQRVPLVDERTLTRRLLGGSYRDGDDGGEQQMSSRSSTPGRKIPTTPLSSNSTKTMGNSAVSGERGEGGREGEVEHTLSMLSVLWQNCYYI